MFSIKPATKVLKSDDTYWNGQFKDDEPFSFTLTQLTATRLEALREEARKIITDPKTGKTVDARFHKAEFDIACLTEAIRGWDGVVEGDAECNTANLRAFYECNPNIGAALAQYVQNMDVALRLKEDPDSD